MTGRRAAAAGADGRRRTNVPPGAGLRTCTLTPGWGLAGVIGPVE